jgi:two-component system, sensor histidine kinase and response regulator
MVQDGSFASRIVKILLAEDNPVNQEVISEMLISIGCQVKVVSNGQQVLDALNHDYSYDIIFMDCQMPIMDGHEAAIRIRSLEPQTGREHIPIIGITGRVVRDNYEKSEKAYMDDLLDKPFTIEQLKNTVFRWTGIHLQEENPGNGKATISNECFSLPVFDGNSTYCLNVTALKAIAKLEKGSKEFLKKIVSIYFRDTPNHIFEIQKGIQEKNPDKILQAAHSLKSTSANIGAMTLSDICQELESNARLKIIDDAVSQLARIKSEYAEVVTALNSFINEFESQDYD